MPASTALRDKAWANTCCVPPRKANGRSQMAFAVIVPLADFVRECYHRRKWAGSSSFCDTPLSGLARE